MQKVIRPHPLTIRKYLTKYSLILFIPAAQGVAGLYTAGNVSRTLMLLLAASLLWTGISAARLKRFRLYIRGGLLSVPEGLVFRRSTSVQPERICCILVRRTPLTALFKSAEIRVETEAGGRRRADFTCVLRDDDIKILTGLAFGEYTRQDEPVRFGVRSVLIYAFTASAAAGILTAAPVIDKAGQILGEGIAIRLYGTVSRAALLFAEILPEAGGFAAVLLLAGYIISALISILKCARFRIYKGNTLIIKSGIVSSHTVYIRQSGIVSVTARQGILLKILSRKTVRISAAGYGKRRWEPPLLIPSLRGGKAGAAISEILPGFTLPSPEIKSARGSLPRFILLPCAALCAVSVLSVFLFRYSVFFSGIYLLGGIASVIYLLLLISAEISCFRRGGITLGNRISGTGRRGLRIITRELSPKGLGLLSLSESPADRRRNQISVSFCEYSEKARRLKIRYLDKSNVAKALRGGFGIEI